MADFKEISILYYGIKTMVKQQDVGCINKQKWTLQGPPIHFLTTGGKRFYQHTVTLSITLAAKGKTKWKWGLTKSCKKFQLQSVS